MLQLYILQALTSALLLSRISNCLLQPLPSLRWLCYFCSAWESCLLSWLLRCLWNTAALCHCAGGSGRILADGVPPRDLLAVLEVESSLLDNGFEATLPSS